jgi:hypothetical protein
MIYTMPLTHAALAPHPNARLGSLVECEHGYGRGYGRLLVPPTSEPELCWFDTVQRPINTSAVYVAGRGCGMTLTNMLDAERGAGVDHFARLLAETAE